MEHIRVYILPILIIWLFLAWNVTGEPVCYSRKVLNENNAVVKQVDCKAHSNTIYKRFDSHEVMITSELLADVLDEDPGKYTLQPDTDVCLTECTPVTCLQSDLPVVVNGTFQCSGSNFGDNCQLICNNGSYPVASEKTICERNCSYSGAWSIGHFECAGCEEWTEWMGNYYRLTQREGGWNTTLDTCRSYPGCSDAGLVSIENEKQNDHVQKLAAFCSLSWIWIGLNETEYDWKSKLNNEATYFNWADDQPKTKQNRRCVSLNHISGKWHDVSCHNLFYAVCEGSTCAN